MANWSRCGSLVAIGMLLGSSVLFIEPVKGELLSVSPITAQATDIIQIIDVQLNVTEAGLEIVLVTDAGTLSLPQTTLVEQTLIAEIPNAVLALPNQNEFEAAEPADGIALVRAVNLSGDVVRLSITGIESAPVADVAVETQALRLSVAPESSPTFESAEEPLRLVVTGEQDSRYGVPRASTATRTDTPLDEIPQSIQVIPREILEDQQVIRLNDALRNASGVVSNSLDQRGQRFIIRGFSSSSILRDGFRQTYGSSGNACVQELANI